VVIKGFWLTPYLESQGERLPQLLSEVMGLLEKGVMSPYSGEGEQQLGEGGALRAGAPSAA
jgi:hypothetical protein